LITQSSPSAAQQPLYCSLTLLCIGPVLDDTGFAICCAATFYRSLSFLDLLYDIRIVTKNASFAVGAAAAFRINCAACKL
jgi:hypothetical protein